MRISKTDAIRRHPVDGDGLRRARRPECDRDAGRVAACFHVAATERKLELVAAVTVEKIARHAARAIPAGLAERTVGVVDGHRPAATSRRADDQDAVRADATPAVAELADALGIELVGSVDDHEIVSAALHLGELHAAASTIAGSGSVAIGSNQRIAGSRRNQVIWRRE